MRILGQRRLAQKFLEVTLLLSCLSACGKERMPAPEVALSEYREAVEAKDVDRLYGLLNERARREISRQRVSELLVRDQAALTKFAAQVSQAVDVRQTAELALAEGTVVELEVSGGTFWITSIGGLPPTPSSVEQAARLLKKAVSERSYDQALSLMSQEGKEKWRAVFERLEDSLRELDSAVVEVNGDRATIEFESGLILELKQEAGVWKVDDLK